MQLRCKCGYTEDFTIHKDGLEAVAFTCDRCVRKRIRPGYMTVVVSRRTTLIVKRARVAER